MISKIKDIGPIRTLLRLAAMGLLSIGSTACAGVITINQTDGGPGAGNASATNIAGIAEGAYIETLYQGSIAKNDTNPANLRDNSGSATGISLSKSGTWGTGAYQVGTAGFNAGASNQSNKMMENYTDTSGGSITFTGLNAWLATQGHDSYKVYVYTARNSAMAGSYAIGAEKYFIAWSGGNYPGPFTRGTDTTLAAAQSHTNTANYVLFEGVTGDSFTLNVQQDGGSGWLTVNGIQIVSTSSGKNLIAWGGSDGDWAIPANWDGGVTPVTNGTDDVQIPAGTAQYSGQLDFTGGSNLTVNGGILQQTTAATESLSFQGTSHFAVIGAGEINAQVLLSMSSSPGNTVTGGTVTSGRLSLESESTLTISDGSFVTAESGQTMIDGGSVVTVGGSTLTLRDVWLGDTGGSPSSMVVGSGAMVELDAAGLATATDVVAISGNSFINFPAGSSGIVVIDHISLAQVESMITTGKFGLGGVRYINPAGYSLFENGTGVEISEGFAAVEIVWGGGDADWKTGSNWLGGEVPRTGGKDDVVISSGTANYAGDLTLGSGSSLMLDGGTLTQTTAGTEWLRFHEGSNFTITNGGDLNAQVRLRLWRSAGNTVDNGTIDAGQLQVDDNANLTLSNGAVVTATAAQTILNNNSWIEVGDGTTLSLRDVSLGAYAGFPTFIKVLDGGTLRLDAAGLATPANVITIEGGSFINLASDTTSHVFIDNISQADFQALIVAGKFGIDQTRITDPARYELAAQGGGFVIHGLSVAAGPGPQARALGFNVSGDFEIQVTDLNPSKSYKLTRGSDLANYPDQVGSTITGQTGFTFTDETPLAGKAFYRLEEVAP